MEELTLGVLFYGLVRGVVEVAMRVSLRCRQSCKSDIGGVLFRCRKRRERWIYISQMFVNPSQVEE